MSEQTPEDPDPRILIARNQLDPDVPFITAATWPTLVEAGWRLEENHSPKHIRAVVEVLQQLHGAKFVTIGWKFTRYDALPTYDPMIHGVYIRDGQAQIDAFHDMLDDDDLTKGVIQKWTAADAKRKFKR